MFEGIVPSPQAMHAWRLHPNTYSSDMFDRDCIAQGRCPDIQLAVVGTRVQGLRAARALPPKDLKDVSDLNWQCNSQGAASKGDGPGPSPRQSRGGKTAMVLHKTVKQEVKAEVKKELKPILRGKSSQSRGGRRQGRGKTVDGPRVQVTPADKQFTFLQSRSDKLPFSEAFLVEQKEEMASAGSIVWQQTLSAYALAAMQQHYQENQSGTILNALENFMQYDITELKVVLTNATAPGIDAEMALIFVPVDCQTETPEQFLALVNKRRNGAKGYPGTHIFTLSQLRSKKCLTFEGDWQRGGRPTGLSGDGLLSASSIVGKCVLGFVTAPVVAAVFNGAASSSGVIIPEAETRGPLCQLAMHVKGNWIYTAPNQHFRRGQLIRTRENIQFAGVSQRVDPNGIGDYDVALATGVTPEGMASLVPILSESAPSNPAEYSIFEPHSLALEDGTTNTLFSTTVEFIGESAVQAVAAFFPPVINQLVIWGGRALLGVIDTAINTQGGMLAKEKKMATDNHIGGLGGGNDDTFDLTPAAISFTPGAQGFNQVQSSPVVQQQYTQWANAATSAPSSVAAAYKAVWDACIAKGIYPFSMSADHDVTGRPFGINAIFDAFVQMTGGVPALSSTLLQLGSRPDDALAGVPLCVTSVQPMVGTLASRYPPQNPIQTFMTIGYSAVTTEPYFSFWDSLSATGLTFQGQPEDLLEQAIALGEPSFQVMVSQFFGREPVASPIADSVLLSYEATYACLGVGSTANPKTSVWSIEVDRPAGIHDSGHISHSFNQDGTNHLTQAGHNISELLTRHNAPGEDEDGDLYPLDYSVVFANAILYHVSLRKRSPF